jgi:alpha-L-fucosidase
MLREVGVWLSRNGDAIYGAGIAGIPKPEWGYYTRRGNTLYAHVMEPPIGPLALTGVPKHSIRSARLLATGETLEPVVLWLTDPYADTAFYSFGENPAFTYPLPDEVSTVIEVELAETT